MLKTWTTMEFIEGRQDLVNIKTWDIYDPFMHI